MGTAETGGASAFGTVVGTWRRLGVAVLLVVLLAVAGACGGGSSEESGTAESGEQQSAAAADSFLSGYPKALEALAPTAADAVLIAGGTSGLAFADIPDSWTYSFVSPGSGHIYRVTVEHGKAGEPTDLGKGAEDNDIVERLDVDTIEIGAAEAVALAREHGSADGTVPMNVVVGGVFAQTPLGMDAGLEMGIWSITFSTGTDLADAREFTVDMMTGEVAEATE